MKPYEVYAVRYAHHERRAAENFIGGDPHDGPMPLDYYVWAIVGAGRVVVLDTGYDLATGSARGRQLLRPVEEGLAAVGVEAAQVRDVVISHMHYDHAGNHHLFPQARYHLQDDEMAFCTGRAMCHELMRAPFEARDVQAMVGRFALGAHSQVVEVAANDGYLLQYVMDRGIPCLGVEPTASTAAAARAVLCDLGRATRWERTRHRGLWGLVQHDTRGGTETSHRQAGFGWPDRWTRTAPRGK